jgi:hypothetical protein
MAKVDQPNLVLFCGLNQDRTGAIAENDASGAVGVVDDRRHRIGADDQDLGVRTRLDQLSAHLQGVKKTGASCGKVKSPGAVGTQLVLHQAGGGWE